MAVKRKPIYVLILPRFEDIFHSFYTGEITKGVNLAASRLNVDFLVHITDRSDHSTWLDPTLLDRKYVDGILFADIDNDLDIVKKAIMRGMPCLVLNNIIHEPINYIAVNNYKAAMSVVEEFIKLGHKHIATIAGDLSTQAGQSRLEGYNDALKKHNIEPDKAYIKIGGFLRTPARQAAADLFKLKTRPTAIFAASDVMAMEAMDVAKSKKISIPSDVSICGFDDNPLRAHSPIPLATVAQPLVEMGRLGLEMLYQISHGKAKLPVKEVLLAKIIKAESMGKVSSMKVIDLRKHIRDIPNFPKEGIIFKDISTLLKNPQAFKKSIDTLATTFKKSNIKYVVGVEARGFIFGAALAYKLGAGFIPVRKKGKLPYKTTSVTYQLEYGMDTLEIHEDAIPANARVLIVDDLLATGGTVKAVIDLLRLQKAKIVGLAFLVELQFLKGKEKFKDVPIYSVIQY